jgi:hypothetical protein
MLSQPAPGSAVAFAFEHDVAAFVVALAATWRRGHTVALPVDARRLAVGGTLRLPGVVGFLHDTGAGTGIHVPALAPPEPAAPALDADWLHPGPLWSCAPAANGGVEPRVVSAAALQAELAAAIAAAPLAPGDRLCTTYAPGHLPALAVGILAPLQQGAAVFGAVDVPAPALAQQLAAHAATALLASPDRLRDLARAPAGTFSALRSVRTLGWLDATSRQRWRQRHGLEVVGLGAPSSSAASTPATTALLEALFAMPGVCDAALARLAPPQAVAPRWCVVVQGEEVQGEALSAPRVQDALAPLLAPDEPAPLVAVVDRLGRDVNGALPEAAVFHACGRTAAGAVPNRALGFGELCRAGEVVRCAVAVPSDFAGFEGHFHGHPVLSGAVQLHDVVLPVLRRALAHAVVCREFADVKFLARIEPGHQVELTLTFTADGRGASFVLARGEVRCTTGRVLW